MDNIHTLPRRFAVHVPVEQSAYAIWTQTNDGNMSRKTLGE